jgi:hypothetical protein
MLSLRTTVLAISMLTKRADAPSAFAAGHGRRRKNGSSSRGSSAGGHAFLR